MYTRRTEDDVILVNNLIVERDPSTVTVLLLVQDSAARIFVGAGKIAIQNGVNAGQLATKLAALLGGGGGGRDYFGQGGGDKTNLDSVTKNSEQNLRLMLTK